MCSIIRVHSNHSLCPSVPKFTDLICSVHQYPSHQNWLPFVLICVVDLEYIVTINFVCPYPNLLTLYVQCTKTLAVKKWLPLELICAVDIEYIVTILFPSVPKFTDLISSVHQDPSLKKWLPFELICALYLEYIVTIHFVCPYPNLLTLFSGMFRTPRTKPSKSAFHLSLYVKYT